MTRLELITRALRIVGDITLTADAADWLEDVLLEFEGVDCWRFLEESTTYQTEDTVDNIAFSASKWPSSALTDYSKGLFITSDEVPFGLEYVPKVEFMKMHKTETGFPRIFSFWDDTLWLDPTPITGSLPLLTVHYYAQIVLPTADGDELSDSSKTAMPKKWHPVIMKGVIAHGLADTKNTRWKDWQDMYENLALPRAIMDNSNYSTGAAGQFGRVPIPARASKQSSEVKV